MYDELYNATCSVGKENNNRNRTRLLHQTYLSRLMRLWHFFVLRKLILQTHMRSHPVGLDVWFFVGPFVYFPTSCVRTATALAKLRGCAGSPEPLLVAYVISTIISWAGPFAITQSQVVKSVTIPWRHSLSQRHIYNRLHLCATYNSENCIKCVV